ncbi:hypothetical protein EUX98_g6060 [Antrodiella citrinella]|uniref:Nucleolar 27S pre-rRNA processing Urb2/Npa2 C-terminal domain-containing protein n=1 Tax=Antrodiella citrinella TaxID=2447956 RepID=A0A4S4MS39_9APHY|nr:hypothetical protein EUX98_g6060 [Antrodiella citrinella]
MPSIVPLPSDLQNIPGIATSSSSTTQNALDLVRALKAPADPPHLPGPTKIQIAQAAWNNNSFYMPNKAETIAEWILTRLLKDKTKDPKTNPLLDIQYWILLEDVLIKTDARIRDKAWLIPLLNRIPIAPIVVSFVSLCSQSAMPAPEAIASRCLSAIWPLAVPKFSSEALLECYGALLDYAATRNAAQTSENLASLGSHVVRSYRSSLVNASNKKKLYTSFIQNHLQSWLEYTASGLDLADSLGYYAAGIETLFNVDSLRSFQEQHAANAFEKALLIIASARPDIVLEPLPRVFRSHSQAQTRHRAALYGQGSKQTAGSTTEQARSASMMFFALCETILSQVPETESVWKVRAALLLIVDQEGLLSRSDESSANVLRCVGDGAIGSLGAQLQLENQEVVESILAALTMLTRIDYDLIPFALNRVLPILVKAPSTLKSASKYLQQLLEYHTKTRTMDAYVISSLQAFTLLPSANNIRVIYTTASAGPLLHHVYMELLSRSVRNYLTPGQVLETAQNIIQQLVILLDEWRHAQDGSTAERPQKKRRLESPPEYSSLTMVKFTLVASSAAAVLSYLPLHSLLPDAQQEVRGLIQEALTGFASHFKAGFKAIEKKQDAWGWQILLVAVFRFRYTLVTASILDLHLEIGEKTVSRMFSCLKTEHITSELRIEIIRSLLLEVSQGRCDVAPVFDEALACIAREQSADWTGGLYTLDTDDRQVSVAVLHLLCDKWLPLFHQMASDEQIALLIKIFQQILRDAQFWELNRLRDTLLAQIIEKTSPLDQINLAKIWTQKAAARHAFYVSDLFPIFEVILSTPQECLSRETRNSLFQRALAADAIVTLGSKDSAFSDEHLTLLVYLREFIRRTITQSSVEHTVAGPYLFHLIDSLSSTSDSNSQLASLTLELVRTLMSSVISAASKHKDTDIETLIQRFLETLRSATGDRSSPKSHLAAAAIFVNLLTSEHKFSHFTDTVIEHLRDLQEQLYAAILPQVTTQDGLEPVALGLWWHLLALRRWLNVDISRTPLVATKLASRLLSSSAETVALEVYSATLAIALEELYLDVPDRSRRLDFVVAAYLSFSRIVEAKDALDEALSKASKSLQVEDFDGMLDAVADGLKDEILPAEALLTLIHLSSLLLHNSPEGTLKVVQKHTAQCLTVFVNRSVFVNSTSLTLKALELVSRYFSDRPSAIRSTDVASAWSFIGHCLAGSPTHSEKTSTAIFQEVISVIGTVVRLRRDLVLPTLPLLGFGLHKLILILRTLSPNLGATQSKMVSDTLPRWVNATDPVTAEESKSLARLLTTITTKTIVRTHTSSNTETQKADSLARPFSKHADHVLSAYLAALNDPLCHVSSAIRKELEPGLFALCEVMGEQNRDALMVALDSGEKSVMKGLWRAYEKQRYVGKG